eukprot:CAMPEP_0182557764 /NCGR_PEP_ID=MMETSP1324-20130603/1564_1 /TAXON_ID=236786 /ORGANISM="Florenciella sp., Strain RCC1587" /LENGTH=121 /DNA_ID=CAMNT_0024769869 /DNA_START=349 /DNA_END=714 /DNA_ORIENTATION=+
MTHAGGVLSNDFVALVLAFSNTGEAAHLRHREESLIRFEDATVRLVARRTRAVRASGSAPPSQVEIQWNSRRQNGRQTRPRSGPVSGGERCVVAQVRPSSRSKTPPRPRPPAATFGAVYLA